MSFASRTARCCLAGLMALATTLAGCPPQADRPDPPPEVQRIDHVDLWVPNAPSNLDSEPGVDGVNVTLMFYRDEKAQSVGVGGTLELMIFEGTVKLEEVQTAAPFHTWTLTGKQLRRYLGRIYGVWAYSLTLTWGDQIPSGGATDRISIVARYKPASGRAVWSRVGYVPMKS
jgi:hypothetical protein